MNLKELVKSYSLGAATVATHATHATPDDLKPTDSDVSAVENAEKPVASHLLRTATVATHDQKYSPDVADVADVAVARRQKQKKRWAYFVRLVMSHDVSADEVQSRFTFDDKIDLVAEPDEKLPLHAQTIADDIKRTRTPQELIEHDIATSDVPELVRAIHAPTRNQTCGSCKHFRRHDWHGHLGTCDIKAQPEAASGLWDNDPRNYCDIWSS